MKLVCEEKDLGLNGFGIRGDISAWLDVTPAYRKDSIPDYSCANCGDKVTCSPTKFCCNCGSLMINYKNVRTIFESAVDKYMEEKNKNDVQGN